MEFFSHHTYFFTFRKSLSPLTIPKVISRERVLGTDSVPNCLGDMSQLQDADTRTWGPLVSKTLPLECDYSIILVDT